MTTMRRVPYVSPDFWRYLRRPDVQAKPDLWRDIEAAYMKGDMSVAAVDPQRRDAFEATTPDLAMAAPHLFDRAKRDVIQSRVLDAALREYHSDPSYKWVPQYQRYGTCVGQNYKLGADQLLANRWLRGLAKFPGRAAAAGMYAGGRVDVSHQPGRWEGSFNHATSEWMTKGGILLLKSLGLPDDARDQDEALAMKWTNSREGVPKDLEDDAKEIVATLSVRAKGFDDCAAAIDAGGVVHWAGTLIPSGQTDRHGFSKLRRSRGGHSVCGRNLRTDIDGISYDNSWSGDWARDAARYPDDQPPGSVWLHRDDCDWMCSEGDCWLTFDVSGLDPEVPGIAEFLV